MIRAADIDDPRMRLARPDLADAMLEGLVRAERFAATRPMHASAPVVDLFDRPGGARVDQLLHGEAFDVLDVVEGMAWGRARRDGVVGWVSAFGLAPGAPLATHRVRVADARLPLNALVVADDMGETLADIGDFDRDPAAVAERLLGTPHALGGRSSIETDCAGLVQQALAACGREAPRYADQQARLGADAAEARRGDLIVWLHPDGGPGWSGHSALMLDDETLIHASGDAGRVVVERVSNVDDRYQARGFAPPRRRRLDQAG